MKRIRIYRSIITKTEFDSLIRRAITPNTSSISNRSLKELANLGADKMKKEGFHFPDVSNGTSLN